ncbi:MAG: hypothetical protein CSA42_04890 [Gammaproteobacteria bacterium]|nr:MAG: hypothetical protein CSA42_04890 [Gammaproteobacteria bacterium]
MSKQTSKKLPKNIAQMVEKNNFVIAIKTLVAEDNISFAEAKARIDAYEKQLKQKQETEQQKIVNQQSKSLKTETNAFNTLQNGIDKKFVAEGCKKPLLPYWIKRVIVIVVVLVILLWAFWQLIK